MRDAASPPLHGADRTLGRTLGPALGRTLKIVVVLLLFGLTAWVGIEVTRGSSRIAALWLPNAILVAALLRSHPRIHRALLAACLVINLGVNSMHGDDPGAALFLSVFNTIEVLIVIGLLRRYAGERPVDVRLLPDLFALAKAGVAAALVSGVFAAFRFGTDPASALAAMINWTAVDALGLLIVTPTVLIFHDAAVRSARFGRSQRLRLGETLAWAKFGAAIVLAAGAVFAQSRFPFLFLVTPIVVWAAFRRGVTGTAVAITLVSVVASVATALHSGPVMLVRGDLHAQLITLQLFIACSFLLGVPIAVHLESREAIKAELHGSFEFNQVILNNVREVIFRTDAAGRWSFLNPAWEKLTGYSVAESLGWRTDRLLHPDDRDDSDMLYPQIVSGAVEQTVIGQRFYTRRGTLRYIDVSLKRLANEDGSFAGVTGNIRDVTIATMAQMSLRDSERRFHALANLAPTGIFRTDAEGGCTYVNQAWQRITGLTEIEAQGGGWSQVIHPDDSHVARDWNEAVAARAEFRTEFRWVRPNGTTRWVAVIARPDQAEDERLSGYIGVVIDITHHKEMETALGDARRRAEDAASAKSAFLANMSHEIRTPMNGVLGFADLLLAGPLNKPQRRHAQLIADSGRAMMRLLNNILDVSKIEAGKMRLAEEPIDLAGHARDTVLLMEAIAIGKDVDLKVTIDKALPGEVIGDAPRLRQVILNLVGNALKFTERGSVTVAVTAAARGGERLIRFDVRDTGTGIAPGQLERIFEQFTQADDDRAVVRGGTGLGLAICAQLARLMGGRIEVESRPGEGSTFSLLVPLKTRGAAPHGQPDASRAAAQKPVRPGYRVLVAEDNEINRELMLAIGGHVGLDLVMAVDGEDALRLVDEARANGERFDLVLMDLQMPRLDGLATTRAIRARGIGADDLPIVALSARAYREDVEECLDAGMQGHLAKPMSIAKLNEAIGRFATRPRPVGERLSPAPAIDPALQRKFAARKVGALSLLRTALERDTIDEALIARIVDELHKLAGTAGFFGEDELGRLAADLEARLKRAGPADRRAALVDGAPRLLRAA